ncbi:MAG: vitamin K epoxide reductase family protein [Patescibacteria group bacterium]
MMDFTIARARFAVYAVFLVALAGVLDATYLTVEHFRGVIPPCTGFSNCEAVLTSSYATVFGIPIALFGALYYATAATLAMIVFRKGNAMAGLLLQVVVGAAFLISVLLVGIQQFVLSAYCVYCLVSAGITTVLAVCVALMRRFARLPVSIQN